MRDSVGAHSGSRRWRKLRKRAQTFLPDDVVMNILSRLPAKYVLRYRRVCKLWRDLTSSKDFIDLHIRCSIPMILKEDHLGRVLLDRSKIHKLYGPDYGRVVLSQNGLIVVADRRCSESESVFVIFNPIYRDVVKITVLSRSCYFKGRVCGVFFHPVQKEYCILWEKIYSLLPCKVQYRILNLESDPKWRDIATPKDRIWVDEPVLIIDKHLYWIVEPHRHVDDYSFNCEIMEYDIIKEEFRVIPCPVRIKIKNVNLVNIDGVASVVEVLQSKESVEINIWTLNDGGGEQLWTSCNYVVTSDVYVEDTSHTYPQAIAFRNGEMVLLLGGRLYAWNLKFGTFRKFGPIYYYCTFSPHVISLVSLKNCKSNICMADEDENNQP